MHFISYFLVGVFTAMVGALPLGTSNVAVINTTIKERIQSAMQIIYGAALAEIVLVIIAINFNRQIQDFVNMNIWLQYLLAIILLIVGIILFKGRKECIKDENGECIFIKKRSITIPKQILGFILGIMNPAVLVYWIFVMSFLNHKMIYLNMDTGYFHLTCFIIGVYLGKAATLYGYGRFSQMLKVKITSLTSNINRILGILLLLISLFQFTKLFL